MKLKKIITAILAMCIFVMPISAFASADSLAKTYTGTVDYLIDVKNPDSANVSTTSKTFVVSAVALPDTTVTLYGFDSESGKYIKLYSDNKALETVVGASGLYAQSIELKAGTNSLMVVASNGKDTEAIKLEITVVNSNVADIIRNIWQSIVG